MILVKLFHSGKINFNQKPPTKKNIEAHIGLHAGENHYMFGKHHTNESNEMNRQSHLGKHHNQEAKDKLSKSFSGTLFYNNGQINKRYNSKKDVIPDEFIKGKIKTNK